MNDTPGLARPKKKQTDAQGKPTLTKDTLKTMQKIRSKHGASIADQLISSWAQQTGWEG